MSKGLERKINHLEMKVLELKPIEPHSTRMDWDVTEPEKALFMEFRRISDGWDRERDLTPYERNIFNKVYQIVHQRFFDLFLTFYKVKIPDDSERGDFLIHFLALNNSLKRKKKK